MSTARLLSASASAGATPATVLPEDVFSTYLYTGNGTTQTINNGIDLAGKGGMVWIKARNAANGHALFDTTRGFNGSSGYYLETSDTHAQIAETGFSAFTSSGFSLATNTTIGINNNLGSYSSWTFRKAPKFFDIVSYTGDGTANRVLNHSLGQEVGMIETKATSTSGDWNTYHRSATGDLVLNTTATQTASKTILPSATTTTFTVNGVANTNGVTYVAYLYAHDTSADGIIQCGSFTTDGSGNATVNLGWESQYIRVKPSSGIGDWVVMDNMRGLTAPNGISNYLNPNTSAVESTNFPFNITATGFIDRGAIAINTTMVYIAIRRPMKVPTSGTEVFTMSSQLGQYPNFISGFPVDFAWRKQRDGTLSTAVTTRLTGAKGLIFSDTAVEYAETSIGVFDYMDGYAKINLTAYPTFQAWMFKRAKGFFDVVCYTGTGVARTVNHNLGVAPELMIVKPRSGTYGISSWAVYSNSIGNNKVLWLNTPDSVAAFTQWDNTTPTNISFSTGGGSTVNGTGTTYVAYLFATLAGVSKVGSYTGNGTLQTINCGFTTGARFVLIKRTDSTGDWYIWDSVRGIVAANDPHLSLNTTAAEVTTDDSVDPEVSGFICNQNAATNINVNLATYIFLAIS